VLDLRVGLVDEGGDDYVRGWDDGNCDVLKHVQTIVREALSRARKT